MIEQRLADLEKQVNVLKQNENKRVLDYQKTLKSIKELAIIFLIITVSLKIFGLKDFEINIANENVLNLIDIVNDNAPVRITINILMGVFSGNLMYACVIDDYKNHYKMYNIIIVSYLAISNLLIYIDTDTIFRIPLSFAMYFIPLLTTKRISLCFKILIIDNIFISLSAFLKNIANLDYNYDIFITIILSLDVYFAWILYFINKEVKRICLSAVGVSDLCEKKRNYITKSKTTKLNLLMQELRKNVNTLKNVLRNVKKNFVGYVKVDLKEDLIFKILPAAIVFGAYGLYARMTDKFVEAILLYFAYLHLRKLFPKHFHADYIPGIRENLIGIVCIVLSATTLCITLHNTTNSNLSIFSSIISAFIVNWLLYVVRDWLDYRVELPFIDKLKVKYETDFSKYGLSSEMANFAYDWKITGLRDKELMIKYEIDSVNTLNSRKRRIKQAMNTK